VTLVCTCGLNEILGFRKLKKKIEGEGGRGGDDCGDGAKGGITARKHRKYIFYVKAGGKRGGSVSVIVSLRRSNTLNFEEKGERRAWSECGCGWSLVFDLSP